MNSGTVSKANVVISFILLLNQVCKAVHFLPTQSPKSLMNSGTVSKPIVSNT